MKKNLLVEIFSALLIRPCPIKGITKEVSIPTLTAQTIQPSFINSGAGVFAWMLPLTGCFIVLLLFYPGKISLNLLFKILCIKRLPPRFYRGQEMLKTCNRVSKK